MAADVLPPVDITWRSSNTGTLLLVASTRVIATKLALMRDRGFDVTEAQLALFHALDEPGTRLTALAARARLSKAAMVDLVDRAEAAGWIARADDSADRRAKLVELTAAGRRLRSALTDAIAAAEGDVVAELGAATTSRLKSRLGSFIEASAGLAAPIAASWAAANIGRALALGSQRFVLDVAALVEHQGFDVSPALLGMLRHLDLDGTRLTVIAARARTTKQSMRELVGRAERLGYVVRVADTGDGRARTIAFTPRGRDLLDAVRGSIATAEAGIAAIIGTAGLAEIKRDLVRLAAQPLAVAA